MRLARSPALAAALLALFPLAAASRASAAEPAPEGGAGEAAVEPAAAAARPVAVVMLAGSFEPQYFRTMNGLLDRYLAQVPGAKTFKRRYVAPEGPLARLASRAILARYTFADGREVLVAPTGFDPADGVAVVALLAARYEVTSLVYAGTCGLLSDDCRLFDPLVPTTFRRSDYEYFDAKDHVVFFPDWPSPALKDLFKPTYSLDLSRSPMVKKIEAVERSEAWRKLPAQFLRDFYQLEVAPDRAPRLRVGTTNITGSAFIAGLPSRQRYRDYFKATSVDMHSQQILETSVHLGIPTAAVMTCLDLAGAELPKEDPMNALKSNWSGGVTMSLLLAVLASHAAE